MALNHPLRDVRGFGKGEGVERSGRESRHDDEERGRRFTQHEATARDRSLESSVSAQGEQLRILKDMLQQQGRAIATLTEEVRQLKDERRKSRRNEARFRLISFGYKKKGPPNIPRSCIIDARRIHDLAQACPHGSEYRWPHEESRSDVSDSH